jgi:hypothetical protein
MSNIEKIRDWTFKQFPELIFISNTDKEFEFSFGKDPKITIQDNGDDTYSLETPYTAPQENISIRNLAEALLQAQRDFKSGKQRELGKDILHSMDSHLPSFKEFLKAGKNSPEDHCRAAIASFAKRNPGILSKGYHINVDESPMLVPENWVFDRKIPRPDLGDGMFDYVFECPSVECPSSIDIKVS